MGYLHLGHRHGARVDLGRYLTLDPDADDASQVHESLADASSGSARLN